MNDGEGSSSVQTDGTRTNGLFKRKGRRVGPSRLLKASKGSGRDGPFWCADREADRRVETEGPIGSTVEFDDQVRVDIKRDLVRGWIRNDFDGQFRWVHREPAWNHVACE